MSELTDRLRTEVCREYEGCNALDICACCKMEEAADRIEELQAEIERLRGFIERVAEDDATDNYWMIDAITTLEQNDDRR